MSLLGKLFGRSEKAVNGSIFSFFSNSSLPHMAGKEFLKAYRGWTYACVNAIAEALSEIELTLQEKKKDGWQDLEQHKALELLHKVNDFQSFLDLAYATQAYLELDGNAFWYIPRNGNQAPSEIWYLDPTRT
jgi:phage portal protein BeeE